MLSFLTALSPQAKRFFSVLALLLLLMFARALIVSFGVGNYINCQYCLFANCMAHDLKLFAPIFFMAFLLWNIPRFKAVILLLCAAIIFIYSADILLVRAFSFRLLWSDVVKFSAEALATSQVVRDIAKNWSGLGMLAICVLAPLSVFLIMRSPVSSQLRLRALLLSGAIAVIAWAWPDPHYWYQESYENVLEVNLSQPVDQLYSDEFKARLAGTQIAESLRCENGSGQRTNIIVLTVESLSSYHSKRLGGPLDATPQIDRLMLQHSYFPDFIANSFSTDGGLISLFAGRTPVPAQHRFRSSQAFSGFGQAQNDFYRRLDGLGYESAFFMTADKSFLGAESWMKQIGFQQIEGAESSFYNSWKRGQFNSAEDRALYERVEQWIDQRNVNSSFFLGLLTTSTHIPFINPKTGMQDEVGAMRYADAEIGRFVNALEKRGFFKNGILLITGDHRSMTPLKPEEWRAYGELAYNRVPLIAIGQTGLPSGPEHGRLDGQYQQTDLIPSLLHLLDRQICLASRQGIFLGNNPSPAAIRVYSNAVRRDLVYLSHKGGLSMLHLRGDESQLVGATSPELAQVINAIHRDRIARGPVDDDILKLFLPAAEKNPKK
jgi:lipoteichoic acid synthase